MYEKLFEQSERLFKPFSEIWALQAQAAETLAKTHTAVITEAWNQGVLALQNIPAQKSAEDVYKLQQTYWVNVQESLQEMFDSAQEVFMETNRKISGVLQQSTDLVADATTKEIRSAAAKTSEPLKKTMPAAKHTAAPAKFPTAPPKSTTKAASTPAKTAAPHSGKSAEPARPSAKTEAKTDSKVEAKAHGKEQPTKNAASESTTRKSDLPG